MSDYAPYLRVHMHLFTLGDIVQFCSLFGFEHTRLLSSSALHIRVHISFAASSPPPIPHSPTPSPTRSAFFSPPIRNARICITYSSHKNGKL